MGYYSEVFDTLLGGGILIAASYYYWRLNRRRLERPRVCKSGQYVDKSIEERHDAKLEDELSDGSLEDELSDGSLEDELSDGSLEGELSDRSLGDEGTLTSVEGRHDADIGIEDKASHRSLAGRRNTHRSPEDEDSHRIILVRRFLCSRTGRAHGFFEDIVLVGFRLRRWLETCTTFLRGRPSSSSPGVIPTGEAAEPLPPLDWPPPPPPPEADI